MSRSLGVGPCRLRGMRREWCLYIKGVISNPRTHSFHRRNRPQTSRTIFLFEYANVFSPPPLFSLSSSLPSLSSSYSSRLVQRIGRIYTTRAHAYTPYARWRKKEEEKTSSENGWKISLKSHNNNKSCDMVSDRVIPSLFVLPFFVFFTSFSNNFLMGKEKYNSCFISCLWNTKILHQSFIFS